MRALLSVSDKTNIEWFAKKLIDMGWEIVSTGGTAKKLEESGLDIKRIAEVTGFPECFDGRVKTLHPKVHGAILNIRDNEEHQRQKKELGITDIDLVCVNLYPFEQTVRAEKPFQECIENIDIGGPAMIRSAAKNFKDVLVVTDPSQYQDVVSALENKTEDALRQQLARDAFSLTSHYDDMIAAYL